MSWSTLQPSLRFRSYKQSQLGEDFGLRRCACVPYGGTAVTFKLRYMDTKCLLSVLPAAPCFVTQQSCLGSGHVLHLITSLCHWPSRSRIYSNPHTPGHACSSAAHVIRCVCVYSMGKSWKEWKRKNCRHTQLQKQSNC